MFDNNLIPSSFWFIPSRYFHTIKYLKPKQVLERIRLRIKCVKPDLGVAPVIRENSGRWVYPCSRHSSMLGAHSFRFLNHQRAIMAPEDWNASDVSRLWLYNLHYFDDLNSTGSHERQSWHEQLVNRWIVENPPGQGVGWEPYPVSLRIVNWIKWILSGAKVNENMIHSLAIQTRWLYENIEWHLLGNHLFSNAKALIFSGLFFDGSESSGWLETGAKIIGQELGEQILSDGGQFERSPMYHCLALEDVLDLVNASHAWPGVMYAEFVSRLNGKAVKMIEWMEAMTHPDGFVAQFNDCTLNGAPKPSELLAYANRLGIEASVVTHESLTNLSPSGYIRVQNRTSCLIVDVGLIGPDYLPGHAHADTLSFELSLFGERWVVDSGCSLYEEGSERLRQRGTSAHNTVMVDGQDSSEVWSSFRVAKRARPFGLEIIKSPGSYEITCSHDGYRRLPGHVIHSRKWILRDSQLEIRDCLDGHYNKAQAFVHFHPEVEVSGNDKRSIDISMHDKTATISIEGGTFEIQDSVWHPEFGISIPSKMVAVKFVEPQLSISISW